MEPKVEIIDYSDRSIVVTGETKSYKDYLKQIPDPKKPQTFIKASWNANLTDPKSGEKISGWVYSKNHAAAIGEMVSKINSGQLTPLSSPFRQQTSRPLSVPGEKSPLQLPKTLNQETLTYTVPEPVVGMKGSINWKGESISITVMEVGNPKSGEKDMAFARILDKEDVDMYKLAVTAGEWQVVGMIDEHSVTFSV